MTKEELEEKARDYIDRCTKSAGFVILPEQLKQDFIDLYVAGARENQLQWHYVKDGDLPEENQWVLVYDGSYTVCNYHSNTPIKWLDNYENEVYEGNIIAWKDITPPKEVKEND